MFQKKNFRLSAIVLGTFSLLTGCSDHSGTSSPNYDRIMYRTVEMIKAYDQILKLDHIEAADDDMLKMLTNDIFVYINQKPLSHKNPIGLNLQPDAGFLGFEDMNANNIKEAEDRRMFTMEIDIENDQLVLTDETGAHHGYYTGRSGFFFGAIGRGFGNRQNHAGVKPGRFSNVALVSSKTHVPPETSASGSGSQKSASRARSRARGGGVRSGK